MSDFSGYYQISYAALDGITIVAGPLAWGPGSPTQYRAAAVPTVGRLPVDLITRSSGDPGGTSPPISIAREGAILVVRGPAVSSSAQVGVVAVGTSEITQIQPLTPNPFAKVWTFPGDELWVNDPNGNRGRLDIFVRPMNFRDVDSMLRLPRRPVAANAVLVNLGTQGNVPPPRSPRTIYVVDPPAPGHVYNLPAPNTLTPGTELTFISPATSLPCRLVSPIPLQSQPGVQIHHLASGKTAVLTAFGSFYSDTGVPGDEVTLVAAAGVLPTFRGTQRVSFQHAGPHVLPFRANIRNDAVLVAVNALGAPVTINAQAGEVINTAAGITLAPLTSRIIMPFGPTSWTATS